MTQENRTCEIINQKLIFEAGSEAIGLPGKCAYILQSQTEDEVHYNQSLHESSGLSRIYAEKTLQIEAGIKNKAAEKSLELISHTGDIDLVTRKSGNIGLRAGGGTITLEADNIILKAQTEITIVNPDRTTDQLNLNAKKIQVSRNNGNLGDWMKLSDKYRAFANSFVSNKLGSIGPSLMGGGGLSGIAKAAATAYGGPVAGIAAEAAVDSLTS